MRKSLRTLLLASLFCLPGTLFARTATPFAQPAQDKNAFAAWTPNQLTQTTTDVELQLYLPYDNAYHYFTLEFRSNDTGFSEYFYTNSSMASSGILGSLPAGSYTMFWYQTGGPRASFDVSAGCGYSSKAYWGDYGAIFGLTISPDCNIVFIDKF